MDQLPDRPAALHRRQQILDVVLARPQPSLPHLRPTGPVTQSRRPPDRDRPRPRLHLLGLTLPNPPETLLRATAGDLRARYRHEIRARSSLVGVPHFAEHWRVIQVAGMLQTL